MKNKQQGKQINHWQSEEQTQWIPTNFPFFFLQRAKWQSIYVPLSLTSLFISLEEKCFWAYKDMFYFKFQEFNPKWLIQVNFRHSGLQFSHFWNAFILNFIKTNYYSINFPFVYCKQYVLFKLELHKQGTYIWKVMLIILMKNFN